MTFEKRVYEHEFKLNDTDDSIIEYIKANREDIQKISIQNIANSLYISPNAIMRTAKKLGYSGFSELKFTLQKENNPKDNRTAENRVLQKLPQNIIKSLDVLDDEDMEKLISALLNANNILFVGIGESIFFCEIFAKYLRCMDKKVEYYQQIHDMEYSASHCKKGDVILFISASGETPRIVKLAKNAKDNGIDTYCITHFGKNPLSEVCDGQLCFWGEKRIANGYNVADRSGLMMLVRMVCEEYWKRICV